MYIINYKIRKLDYKTINIKLLIRGYQVKENFFDRTSIASIRPFPRI